MNRFNLLELDKVSVFRDDGMFNLLIVYSLLLPSTSFLYLNKTTIAGEGSSWGRFISGEHIYTTSVVDATNVWFKPGTFVQACDSGQDVLGHSSCRDKLSTVIVYFHFVAICDA
jgi:hypothetical protein